MSNWLSVKQARQLLEIEFIYVLLHTYSLIRNNKEMIDEFISTSAPNERNYCQYCIFDSPDNQLCLGYNRFLNKYQIFDLFKLAEYNDIKHNCSGYFYWLREKINTLKK